MAVSGAPHIAGLGKGAAASFSPMVAKAAGSAMGIHPTRSGLPSMEGRRGRRLVLVINLAGVPLAAGLNPIPGAVRPWARPRQPPLF